MKRSDGHRDFAVFESVFVCYREKDRKYVFEITSVTIALRGQIIMAHLMPCKDVKLAAVELVETFGG